MELDLPLDALAMRLASDIKEDQIVARIDDMKIKKDRHGRPMLQMWLYSDKYGRIVVSLSPSYTNIAVENLKKMGFKKLSDVLGHVFVFKKIRLEKARPEYTDPYPRFVPVELKV